jgi:hypothetical protein
MIPQVIYWNYNGGKRIQANVVRIGKYIVPKLYTKSAYGFDINNRITIYDTDDKSFRILKRRLTKAQITVKKAQ